MNNLLMLFIFVPILALVLLFLNFLFSVHRPDESKISAYECGYSAIRKQNRTDFQIQFYVVAMLFLFPIAVTLYKVNTFGFSIALIFFIVLTIGFILEIGSGAISIAKTTQTNYKK